MPVETFFTSDTHFGHSNIIKYCNRPFTSVDEMDQYLIDKWNSVVSSKDVVYHLGDFCFYKTASEMLNTLSKLNGKIRFILGNHDKFINSQITRNTIIESISSYQKIYLEGKTVVLFHYPILSWENQYHGSIHLYGHIHNSTREGGGTLTNDPMYYFNGNSYNVGVDVNNFAPLTLDNILNNIESKTEQIIPVIKTNE